MNKDREQHKEENKIMQLFKILMTMEQIRETSVGLHWLSRIGGDREVQLYY